MADTNTTVGILACCLICLLLLLLFLYKKLNREADGEYTIRNIVYKKGGVRDRARGAAVAVETRLGIQLWPHSDEEGEERSMEEGQASCSQQGDDTDGEDEQDQDSEDQSGSRQGEEGDKPSLDSSEPGEQDRLLDNPEENDEREQKQEVPQDNAEAVGTELQIDLVQFSGSVIWSEEGDEGKSSDVTEL